MAFLSRAACLLWLLAALDARAGCRVLDPELAGDYQGGCKAGLAEGVGHASGAARYVGEFREGKKHGRGTYTLPNGAQLDTRWVADQPLGPFPPQWQHFARRDMEKRAALQPGATACRRMILGHASDDWLRARLINATATRLRLVVLDPGQNPHLIDGQAILAGSEITDLPAHWQACRAARSPEPPPPR